LTTGGDLNGHVGKDRNGYEEIMGVYGFGDRNKDGEKLLKFCQSRRLTVSNTLFAKEDEKRIIYKSGGAKTQIDYILVRKNGGMKVTDCKVIPGDACLTQHRLVRSDLRVEGIKSNKRMKGEKKKNSGSSEKKLREENLNIMLELEWKETAVDGKN